MLDLLFCWHFSFFFFLCFILFYLVSILKCIMRIWFTHIIQYDRRTLLTNLLFSNYWPHLVISFTWSQQYTVAKVLEVIVISHSLTRVKDAFVSQIIPPHTHTPYPAFFSLVFILQGKKTSKYKLQTSFLHLGISWL